MLHHGCSDPRLAAALLLLAATVAAQTNSSNWNAVKGLTAGTDVRILSGSRTLRDKIDGVTDDAIAVRFRKGQETFKQSDVMRVSVRTNSHRARRWSGSRFRYRRRRGRQLQELLLWREFWQRSVHAAGSDHGILVGTFIPTGGWREIYRK